MHIESRDIIPQPVDVVYPLIRDHLDEVVPYLPNVKRIEQIKYERTGDNRVEIVNHWFAIAEVPGPVRKVLKPEFFSWKDYAQWKDDDRCVDYRLESFLANDLFDASGTNYLTPMGADRTEIRVTCNLEIHGDRVPGVPKFVLKRLMPVIETVIKQLLAPNLRSVGKGVAAYYRAQARAAPPAR